MWRCSLGKRTVAVLCSRSAAAAAECTAGLPSGSTVLECSRSPLVAFYCSTHPLGITTKGQPSESDEEQRSLGNAKVKRLADEILSLSLLEVSDLTTIMQEKLGFNPAMMGGGMMGGALPAAAAPAAAAPAPVEEKTEFDVKLAGFDAASKIKVIKEVRAVTSLGLKEAKELVEKSPVVIKAGLKKEEAEELKKKLEAVGGKVELE